ncbi:unnamed protein product [Gulo gulo]|uniref:Uncharacterized protein n=1 Tax=Gulo gulo TaxID=48420 RepID=A0A9X9M851_GULGU|nr:unnamed protein product [Gulo gulo]
MACHVVPISLTVMRAEKRSDTQGPRLYPLTEQPPWKKTVLT